MSSRSLKRPRPAKGFHKLTIPAVLFVSFCIDSATSLAGSFQSLKEMAAEEIEFLEKIEKDSLQFFTDYTDSGTGLTRDSSRPGSPASIAATGFGLASIAIAYANGWIPHREASRRIQRSLFTLLNKADHERGFFYHFLDAKTGKRAWRSEASSIDTALLVSGALVAGETFKGTPIESMAHEIYRRVDWPWMLNGSDRICMGWKPESGFLPYYWDSYSELIVLLALAIGSPTHPAPAKIWNAWFRLEDEYNGRRIVYSHTGSLFTYQYSHAFIDFRELSDGEFNYFRNSIEATWANKEFCLANALNFRTYRENSWGLSACLGPDGYKAYGAKPGLGLHDGTVAPHAIAGSVVFTPEICVPALRFLFENYAEQLYGRYGFLDAFNIDRNWWAKEYLGVDQGISALMIENFRTQRVWEKFMKLDPIQRWIRRCGLRQKGSGSRQSQKALRDSHR